MPVYMVDRTLTGISMDELAGAQKAAIETSKKFTTEASQCVTSEVRLFQAKHIACACLRLRTACS